MILYWVWSFFLNCSYHSMRVFFICLFTTWLLFTKPPLVKLFSKLGFVHALTGKWRACYVFSWGTYASRKATMQLFPCILHDYSFVKKLKSLAWIDELKKKNCSLMAVHLLKLFGDQHKWRLCRVVPDHKVELRQIHCTWLGSDFL